MKTPSNQLFSDAENARNNQAPKVLKHRRGPNRNGSRKDHVMAVKPNISPRPDSASSQWKSIGDLAADLVKKAVQK